MSYHHQHWNHFTTYNYFVAHKECVGGGLRGSATKTLAIFNWLTSVKLGQLESKGPAQLRGPHGFPASLAETATREHRLDYSAL